VKDVLINSITGQITTKRIRIRAGPIHGSALKNETLWLTLSFLGLLAALFFSNPMLKFPHSTGTYLLILLLYLEAGFEKFLSQTLPLLLFITNYR
jgi:hypothetical protein